MSAISEIVGRSVAAEMAVYIGVSALSAPPGATQFSEKEVILLLSADGFTSHEINENLEQAMSMALPGRYPALPSPLPC